MRTFQRDLETNQQSAEWVFPGEAPALSDTGEIQVIGEYGETSGGMLV